MKTLTQRLNFSDTNDNNSSIKIDKTKDINYFDTFCMYCADNDVDIACVTTEEFDAAAETFEDFNSPSNNSFYFWID